MENSKPTKTPCCPSTRLLPHVGVALSNPTEFQSMVGALQYLTFTRPNLAFSVHQLCQFMSKPTTAHLEVAKRVLRYIHGTLYHGISFTPGCERLPKRGALKKEIFGCFFKTPLFLGKRCGVATYFLYKKIRKNI